MKKLLLLFILLAGTFTLSPGARGATTPLALQILSSTKSAAVGASVEITVALVNVSNVPVTIGVSRAACEFDFDIEVRDGTGRLAPLSDCGKVARHEPGANVLGYEMSTSSLILQPGGEFQRKIEIGKLYGIEAPGIYTIRVRWKNGDHNGRYVLSAPRVTFTVIK